MNRHLLDIASLGDADIARILERAQAIADGAPAGLEHAVIANLFYEPSTRTRVAFERAAAASPGASTLYRLGTLLAGSGQAAKARAAFERLQRGEQTAKLVIEL